MDRVVQLTGCEFSAMECSRVYLLRRWSLADPCSCSYFRSIGNEVDWIGRLIVNGAECGNGFG